MFSIRLAEYNFNIDNKYNYAYELCKKHYSNENSGILISVTDDEILHVQTGNYAPDYLVSLAIYRKIAEYLIDSSVLFFHGSVVAVESEAYLFAAPSGTGRKAPMHGFSGSCLGSVPL